MLKGFVLYSEVFLLFALFIENSLDCKKKMYFLVKLFTTHVYTETMTFEDALLNGSQGKKLWNCN